MKISRDHLVITVEGELCAGTEAVARSLAKRLRIPCHTERILEEAWRISGISRKLLKRYESRPVRSAFDLTATGEDDMRIPPARAFLLAQIAACRELAREGPCVLVDHHSGIALADQQDHFRVYVQGERGRRIHEYALRRGISVEKARQRFDREDRLHDQTFRRVFSQWGKASSYDMSVNTSTVPPEILAEHIVRYLETVTQEKLIHRPASKTQRLLRQADIVYLDAVRRQDVPERSKPDDGDGKNENNVIAFPSSK
ncbi:MAG: cytidylate kinase-like family protein [Oscillospiraceae bacterium]|nr:cytidylate kinase-like family protein [Oscillospiraceae bacterium]